MRVSCVTTEPPRSVKVDLQEQNKQIKPSVCSIICLFIISEVSGSIYSYNLEILLGILDLEGRSVAQAVRRSSQFASLSLHKGFVVDDTESG